MQTIATAIAALLLFKLMVVHLGLKVTGLWSYLSSLAAITAFGSSGFANALLFFIPKYQLSHDRTKVNNLINTSFVAVSGISIILCILAYSIFNYVIPFTVNADVVNVANSLLPYIVLSFFFSSLATNYLSVLDGLMLMHVRSKINIAGAFIFLSGGFFLLLKVGIIGIAIAQLIQNIFLLVTSFVSVKKHIPSYKFSVEFNKGVFRSVFKYGFSFQLLSITQISDPFMKAMITKYSGSDITAIFDFCVKLLTVFRSLIVSANLSIVPQISIFKALGRTRRIKTFYKANFKLVLLFSLILFLSPLVLSYTFSLFVLNKISSDFNFILFTVAIGLLINALAFPAHFSNLGIGKLKWNVINNFITTVLIFILAPLMGKFIGGKYIVLSWSISAIVGAVVLIASYSKQTNISIFYFFNKNIFLIIGAILCAGILNKYLNGLPIINNSPLTIFCINLLALALFVFYPLYKNDTIGKIKDTLVARYSTKRQ
ncbi:MAG: lipopolysaccharide biosynthesis protein [Ginsengibacter sp.]